MKKSISVFVCLSVLLCVAPFSLSSDAAGFNKEKATIRKNGTDTYGQAFRKADEPRKLLILTGDTAFMVDVVAYTVFDVAVNSINDKTDPVMIDYGLLSEVSDSGLVGTGDKGFTFTSKGDTYDVEMAGRTMLIDD